MAFVADNSVVLAWFVKSQATAYTEKMLRRAAQEVVHVHGRSSLRCDGVTA